MWCLRRVSISMVVILNEVKNLSDYVSVFTLREILRCTQDDYKQKSILFTFYFITASWRKIANYYLFVRGPLLSHSQPTWHGTACLS